METPLRLRFAVRTPGGGGRELELGYITVSPATVVTSAAVCVCFGLFLLLLVLKLLSGAVVGLA